MTGQRTWCERCERCGAVTPHSHESYAWRLVVAAALAVAATAVFAVREEIGPIVATVAVPGALGLLASAVRARRAGACERCRTKRRREERRTALDPRSTTTTVDM